MNKKFLIPALLAAVGFNAQAGLVAIDDFDSGDQFITIDAAAGETTANDSNTIRTITSTLLASTNPVQNSVEVSFGFLTVTNGSGENTLVNVAWDLDANLTPDGSSDYTLLYKVVESDGNPTNLVFRFEGDIIAQYSIAANTMNQEIEIDVSGFDLNAGGSLEMEITGESGWDLQVDAIGLRYTDPTTPPSSIPEPATTLLMSFGIFLFCMRRKI